MELTKEEVSVLADAIAKKLNEDIKFVPNDNSSKTAKEQFDRFYHRREKYLLNLSIAEIAYMFYLQGISDGPNIRNEIPMEEVISEVEADTFIESVKGWINMKEENVTPLPNNPIVEVIKKVIPCSECQSFYDMYCPGGVCEDTKEEVNLEEQIKENAQCS